jgi:hypothetical protein
MKAERDTASEALPENDVSAKAVVFGGIGLFVGIALSGAIVAGLLLWLSATDSRPPLNSLEAQRIIPPRPRLEIDPAGDRAAIERDARDKITGYAWVDQSRGRARIPIDEAMTLISARGWPDPEERP